MSSVMSGLADIGMEVATSKEGQAAGQAVALGAAGVGVLGVGGAVEGTAATLGAASLAGAGSAITGLGVTAANTAIATAGTVPVVGAAVAEGIATASLATYGVAVETGMIIGEAALALAPVVLPVAAVVGAGWLLGKLFE